MQKIYAGFILYILVLLIPLNITELTGSEGRMFEMYIQNNTIRNLYYLSILINILLIAAIFPSFYKINKSITLTLKIFILILSLFAFALVLYEMYFGSTFYYGEVRDKQFPFGVNNWGFFSTTFLLSYSILQFVYPVLKTRGQRVICTLIVTTFLIIAHILLFKYLETPWRMMIS